MPPFRLQKDDIAAVLRSMALAGARGAFLPGATATPESLPQEARLHQAGWGAKFFGLPPGSLGALPGLDSWEAWAEGILRELPEGGAEFFSFRTSGSTGEPSFHTLSRTELGEELSSLLPLFHNRRRVVSVMPVHHVFGFVFAMLLPKALGIPSLHLPPLPTADFFKNLQDGDVLMAFPMFWKSILGICAGAANSPLPKDFHGVSSSAPCPPEIIEGLLGSGRESSGYMESMIEIYGATEFGAVGMRRRCREPYTLLPHWVRSGLAASKEPVGAGAGETEWGIQRAGRGPQPLPDEAEWLDDRCFMPVRRKDLAVQVGGNNIFPAEVASVLRAHPQVKECAVRLMRPDEGHRLKAFVVPKTLSALERPQIFIRQLKDWSARRLEPAAAPKHFRLGNELPLTAAGKLADWNIMDDASSGANSGVDPEGGTQG